MRHQHGGWRGANSRDDTPGTVELFNGFNQQSAIAKTLRAFNATRQHDTPYYNPIKTFDIVPAFEASHLLWRSYENSWEQIFSAGVGASWQKHYGTDVVTQLGYGQRISWNDVIDAGATLRWEKRPYDGDREHNLYVEFDMTFRF